MPTQQECVFICSEFLKQSEFCKNLLYRLLHSRLSALMTITVIPLGFMRVCSGSSETVAFAVVLVKMYALYSATGAIFLFLGGFISPYLMYLKCTGRLRTVLTISEALSLLSIGGFYIFCSIMLNNWKTRQTNADIHAVMKNNLMVTNRSDLEQFSSISAPYYLHPSEIDTDVYYSSDSDETTQVPDYEELTTVQNINKSTSTDEFLLSYQLLLKNLLNPSTNKSTSGESMRKGRGEPSEQKPAFNMEEMLLQHAMLVYSFVHGLMSLINSTIECKFKPANALKIEVRPKPHDAPSENTEKPITKTPQRTKTKIYVAILVSWLIPVLSTSSIYLVVDFDATPTTKPYFNYTQAKSVLKPLNASLNGEEVNLVVKKIYDIIKTVNDGDIPSEKPPALNDIIKHLNRQPKTTSTRQNTLKPFKTHTFLVFIVLYFVVVFYVTVELAQSKVKDTKWYITCVWVSSLNWLPSILDTFWRIFLDDHLQPSTTTHLFLTLGNANKMFWNVFNLLKIKNVSKINDSSN